MNNVYGAREIYTIRGDMCYDNKVMIMNTAHSERAIPQTVSLSMGEHDTTNSSTTNQKNTPSLLQRLRRRLRTRNIVDILIILIVAGLMGLIELGYIPNTKLGFICKDPTISYPFRGDTVSATTLLLTAFFGPIFVITLVEVMRENSFKRVCIGIVWNYYKECLIGSTLVLLITEIVKVIVGEHRPHFLDSCQPSRDCVPGEFILDYNCTNQGLSDYFKTDVMRSFPSGHTSLSIFVALYCSYLIQNRIHKASVSRLTKPFFIAVCLTYSLICSLSRITDRRHHWWDVLAGAVFGVCGVIYTVSLLRQNEERKIKLVRSNTSTTTLVDVKNKDATSVII